MGRSRYDRSDRCQTARGQERNFADVCFEINLIVRQLMEMP